MGIGQVLKKVDAFPKLIDIEVNKTFSGALCKNRSRVFITCTISD